MHEGRHWARQRSERLESLVTDVAGQCHAAAFGGWVADSDCAYLVFASSEGEAQARVCVNEPLPFGEPAVGVPDTWTDLDARRTAISDLAAWSAMYAPATVDPTQLMKEMPGSHESQLPHDAPGYGRYDGWDVEAGEWVFAEDAVWLIFHRLGVTSPFQFV